jgi:hypothetical protein
LPTQNRQSDYQLQPQHDLGVVHHRQGGRMRVCTHENGFFKSTTTLVFDMVVEVHRSNRVQTQFGNFQPFSMTKSNEIVAQDVYK